MDWFLVAAVLGALAVAFWDVDDNHVWLSVIGVAFAEMLVEMR